MLRSAQHLLDAAVLDRPPAVHHEHVVGHLADHAQVVRDHDDRRVELGLEVGQQVQDLRLHRDVQRRRRLVGDQQVRVVDQRHRDHRPLAHAAGELVRVLVEAARGLRDADPAEHVDRPLPGLPLAGARVVHPVRLGDLLPHRVVRVQRGERILEDHRHVPAAQPAYLLLRQTDQLAAAHEDLAGDGGALGVVQAQDGQRGHALARAGLADDAERPPALHRERHAVHRADHAVLGVETHPQVAHPQIGILTGALLRHRGAVRSPGRHRLRPAHDRLPSVTKRTYSKVLEAKISYKTWAVSGLSVTTAFRG